MSATTRFRALRGANSVSADDPVLVLDATRELLREMVLLNAIEPAGLTPGYPGLTPLTAGVLWALEQ